MKRRWVAACAGTAIVHVARVEVPACAGTAPIVHVARVEVPACAGTAPIVHVARFASSVHYFGAALDS